MITDSSSSFASALVSPGSVSVAALSICTLAVAYILHKMSCQNYFPSPPSDPILGHIRTMPLTYPWLTFKEWGQKLGDIIYISIIGRPMIILNTAEAALDLMEKRGANYSDRPLSILYGKMIGWEYMTSLTPYGDRFRTQRRFIHQYLNSQAAVSLWPFQTEQVKAFVKDLLVSPNEFQKHLNRLSAASIMKVTYGHDVLSDEDRFIDISVTAMTHALKAGVPGMALVDIFPVLQYIPSWFPGAGFKRKAKIARESGKKMINEPFNKVKEERALGTAQPSLLNTLLEDYENTKISDEEHVLNMKFTAGVMFGAGVETSAVVIETFLLMMARNPDVVKRAQAEIDSVIGNEQLPTLEDRPNLPYIECILKEVFRINPPSPLGVPHQSIEEDVYRERVIPPGSLIIPNIWLMMRDERYFSDPEDFKPERFLDKTARSGNDCLQALNYSNPDDPSSLVFGFGRRICPGRFFADANAWLTIANVLAVFDILPPIDPVTGKETVPAIKYSFEFTSKPMPFDCRIVPRSEKHALLIAQECA